MLVRRLFQGKKSEEERCRRVLEKSSVEKCCREDLEKSVVSLGKSWRRVV